MPNNSIDLQYLLDRTEIQELHLRYFRGVDRGDRDQVRACFTADARATFHGGGASGIDDMMTNLLGDLFRNADHKIGNTGYHFMGGMNIARLEGDEAETETYAFSAKVRGSAGVKPGSELTLRGLRYLDRLERTGQGWQIYEREHVLDWMSNVPASFAASLAERVNGLTQR